MNKRTKSGCLITYSDFWLDWRGQRPDRYPEVSTVRRNSASVPLSRKEAKEYWFRRCCGAEFTEDAREFMLHLLDHV